MSIYMGVVLKNQYEKFAGIFKALGDKNRLMIVELLCGGELCACMILVKFNITQPTLSHHMKILCDCGLVNWRKQGKWTYYSINSEMHKIVLLFLKKLNKGKIKNAMICEKECCE